MVTMEDVAKAANVSRATVSRVLSNHPSIKMETRSNVMYWVRKLGYEPNNTAQSLAGNKSHLIGVLFSDLSNPLYATLMTAIVREAEKEGYNVIVGDAQREKAREVNIIKRFKGRMVDGIIVRPIGQPNQKFYSSLDLPMVSLYKLTDRKNIVISSENGARQVARHFANAGHTKIGYLGPVEAQTGNNKLAGFKETLQGYGIKIHAVLECKQDSTAENQKSFEIINAYLDHHNPKEITAWFAHNDIAASDIIRALKARGISVPEDVSVCGYNDTVLSRRMIPTLTSVAPPIDEIAREAVALLLREINGDKQEETIYMSPRLIVRESTSARLYL